MKRVIVAIFDKYLQAWDVRRALALAGVDAKIVSRHSVQIDPRHFEMAKRVSHIWRCGVEQEACGDYIREHGPDPGAVMGAADWLAEEAILRGEKKC